MGKRKKKPAKPRGPRGEGTVFEDARRGGWVGRVPVGKYPSGRTRYREVRGATQAEVVAKKRQLAPPGPDVTVAEWCDRWLAGLRVRGTTRELYETQVETRVKPALGGIRLAALTPWHCEEAAAAWAKELEDTTLAVRLTQLSSMLRAAVRAGLIPTNPAAHVRRPRAQPVKFDLFSPEELRKVIATASTRREWYPFALCAAMGLRIGEATALQPADYKEGTGELKINRTRTRSGTNPPKSPRSLRTVRVPAVVRPLLEKGVPGADYPTMAARWKRLLKAAGLRFRVPHQLRHSFASHTLAAGCPVADVAKFLGDSPGTIMRVYCHPTGADVCGAMEKLLGGTEVAGEVKSPAKRRQKRA